MGWGLGASVLVLETLKRALSPVNRARVPLVAACLSCALVPQLLKLLDWQAGGGTEAGNPDRSARQQQAQDAGVQRVLAVEVLHLLADGENGPAAEVLPADCFWPV